MGLLIDIHVHTKLHSSCSHIDPDVLIREAVKVGLDGLVITEHQHQWRDEAIAELVAESGEPHFLVMAGFEYTSLRGDVLIYGLAAAQAAQFRPGMPPEEAIRRAHELGGVCVAAHPTRIGLGFDEQIATLPLDAMEVQSTNLDEHEQRLAAHVAAAIPLRPVAASDAHELFELGTYATEFLDPIQSMADLQESFRRGTFRPAASFGLARRMR